MKNYLLPFICLFMIAVSAQNPSDSEDYVVIEKVPIYPGCEGLKDNESLKNCMFRNIYEHINKNFDISFARELGLVGKQRIEVGFTINKNGYITDIKAKGPHPRLEEEAHKIMTSFPIMIPGEQKGEPVGVRYLLPIVFEVEE